MKKIITLLTLVLFQQSNAQLVEYQRWNVEINAMGGFSFDKNSFSNEAFAADENPPYIGYQFGGKIQYRLKFNKPVYVGAFVSKQNVSGDFYYPYDYHPDPKSRDPRSKIDVVNFGPMFTVKFQNKYKMSNTYFSLGAILSKGTFELSNDTDHLISAKASGYGGFLELGYYYFLTDNLAISPSLNLSYIDYNKFENTIFNDKYNEYTLQKRFGVNLGVSFNYFY